MENGNKEDASIDCKLLDGWALLVQGCMGTIALSILILKRQREKPKRPFKIWFFDAAKQVIGQLIMHCLNITLSYIKIFNSSTKESNPCIWYFLNLFMDTTVGVLILMLYIHISEKLIELSKISNCKSGYYGPNPNKPQYSAWIKQTIIFVICLALMKLTVITVISNFEIFVKFGQWVIGKISPNVKIQVIFDMLILPLTMNAIQFWFVDGIIKNNKDDNNKDSEYSLELLDDSTLDFKEINSSRAYMLLNDDSAEN